MGSWSAVGSWSQPLESQPLAISGRRGRSQGEGGKLPYFVDCSKQGILQCMDASGRVSMLAHFVSLP